MIGLREAAAEYLTVRRQLGFELKDVERRLESFICFLEQADASHITIDLAVTWARLPVKAHPEHWNRRLGTARNFARYLATLDPVNEIPPRDLLPAHRTRVSPYIYSEADIAALLDASRELKQAIQAQTYETLIGLMAATGLRLGEAVGLNRSDVDLNDGALHVRSSKQQKQREVPLHDSTTEALTRYSRLRDRRWPLAETQAFFVSRHGRRLKAQAVNGTFSRLIRKAGLEGRGERVRPRPHDLRHTFAVRTLLEWYREGVEVERALPLLSTYLGHVQPVSTYWYLQGTPELLTLVAAKLDGTLGVQS
jgi:integrase/recombinase XerD